MLLSYFSARFVVRSLAIKGTHHDFAGLAYHWGQPQRVRRLPFIGGNGAGEELVRKARVNLRRLSVDRERASLSQVCRYKLADYGCCRLQVAVAFSRGARFRHPGLRAMRSCTLRNIWRNTLVTDVDRRLTILSRSAAGVVFALPDYCW